MIEQPYSARLASLWNAQPERRIATAGSIDAAIWCGPPREIWADVDPDINIVAVALKPYRCRPSVDGRRLAKSEWRKGDFQTMVAGVQPHALIETPYSMLHVYMPRSLLDTVAAEMDVPPGVELIDPEGASDPALEHCFDGLAALLLQGAPQSAMLVDSYGVVIATHLVRHWSNRRGRPLRKSGGIAPHALRRVKDYAAAHLSEDIGLAELAAVANLSPHHFCRAFRQSTGMAPFAWLTAQRIEAAKTLMTDHPAMGLIEVALAVGYGGHAAFATAFRRVAGVAPSAWRLAQD